MNDPYKVLGVRPDATDEEVKKVYRELVKKYHPDQFANNPLADLAQKKLAEINEAYDTIIKMRKSNTQQAGSPSGAGFGGTTGFGGGTGFGKSRWRSTGTGGDGRFTAIRKLINNGMLDEADDKLNEMPERPSEWHYLKGIIYSRKGWHDQAYLHLKMAVDMEPMNFEYRSAFNNINVRNNNYRAASYNRGYANNQDMCNMCQCLLCTDCCCEMAGGDFIPCC